MADKRWSSKSLTAGRPGTGYKGNNNQGIWQAIKAPHPRQGRQSVAGSDYLLHRQELRLHRKDTTGACTIERDRQAQERFGTA